MITSPYVAHIHPYPTRFHGTIPVRPVFSFPYVRGVQSVFQPNDFAVEGLGTVPLPSVAMRTQAASELPAGTTQSLAVAGIAAVLGYVGMRYYLKSK